MGISEGDVSHIEDQPRPLNRGMQVTRLPELLDTSAYQSAFDAEPDDRVGRINECYPEHFESLQFPCGQRQVRFQTRHLDCGSTRGS